jgi:hypothetical protein
MCGGVLHWVSKMQCARGLIDVDLKAGTLNVFGYTPLHTLHPGHTVSPKPLMSVPNDQSTLPSVKHESTACATNAFVSSSLYSTRNKATVGVFLSLLKVNSADVRRRRQSTCTREACETAVTSTTTSCCCRFIVTSTLVGHAAIYSC